MKLRDWMDENGVDNPTLGGMIGRSAEAVRRYANGTRIPDRETMPEIVKATSGRVMANDFFDLGVAPDAVAICPRCDERADQDVALSCTSAHCPMRQREAA